HSKGKIISKGDKYFDEVHNLKIQRFPVDYKVELDEILAELKKNPLFSTLQLSDDALNNYLKNGPYLPTLIDDLQNSPKKYDLIHTTFYPYFNNVIALMIGKKLKIPIIITPFFHFSNPRYENHNLMEILPKFDSIIACTPSEKTHLMNTLAISTNKIHIIPMGVDYSYYSNPINYSFKATYFPKKEQKYNMILFCGYKNYEKGAISILKAIPYILRKIKKIYFVFIGPPTQAFNREFSKVQKIKNTKIINLTPDNLTGYFDKKKIAAFQETDIFVMPSRSDAFGIAFLEAWAAGKPVIGADIGATPEVINKGIDGLIVAFDNPQALANHIINLLKKSRLRKKFGKAGQSKVLDHYTWDKIAEQTFILYQNLISDLK
ncbi:MAG: glycosyltransferase family 1 protein, partial [Promethearchaeota archaeon]